MRKVICINKYEDKITIEKDGEEVCNLVIAFSSPSSKASISVETGDENLMINKEPLVLRSQDVTG